MIRESIEPERPQTPAAMARTLKRESSELGMLRPSFSHRMLGWRCHAPSRCVARRARLRHGEAALEDRWIVKVKQSSGGMP